MRRLSPILAAMLLGACGHGGSADAGGSGGPQSECTVDSDCASAVCIFPDPNTPIGFCSEPCLSSRDCLTDFAGGCCVATTDGQQICAIAAICNDQGDAGLGDACPIGSECGTGLFCIASADRSVTECSQVCKTTADCDGVPQECCEDEGAAGAPELLCVLDAQCGGTSDAGSDFDAGPIGPGGDDGGPFYAALIVDGTLTADTTSFQGTVGSIRDTLFAPAQGSNIGLDLPAQLVPGSYACDGGGPLGDGGSGILGPVSTAPGPVPGFASLLPVDWQNLVVPMTCGPVVGEPALSVDGADLEITQFVPGRLRSPDAGPVRGHLTGNASWRISDTDLGSTLEVRERFDVDLTAP